jgi:HEPN domain-containing protein
MCHLAVEKTLKAVISETSRTPSPRTHNLYRLLELGRIQLPEVHETVVAQLNTMSTATRYPEDIATLEAEVPSAFPQEFLCNGVSRGILGL